MLLLYVCSVWGGGMRFSIRFPPLHPILLSLTSVGKGLGPLPSVELLQNYTVVTQIRICLRLLNCPESTSGQEHLFPSVPSEKSATFFLQGRSRHNWPSLCHLLAFCGAVCWVPSEMETNEDCDCPSIKQSLTSGAHYNTALGSTLDANKFAGGIQDISFNI